MRLEFRIFLYRYSPLFFWGTILALFYLLSLQNIYSFLAVPLMVSLHHGNHETVHGTLIPKTWRGNKRLNFFSGCTGFAILGHNYVLMRMSHTYHHLCGRLHKNCTIEMSEQNRGIWGRASYYLSLLGSNAIYHEIAGYLFPFLPAKSRFLGPMYERMNCRSRSFIESQLFTLVVTLLLLYIGGVYFLICRLLFLPLWGLGQNVAHYALPVGQEIFPEFAARTYRVNIFINFVLYGAGFYHFEHHVMPKVPGLLLWHPSVSEKIQAKLGFSPFPRIGLSRYFRDAFRQFSGPYPQEEPGWLTEESPENSAA